MVALLLNQPLVPPRRYHPAPCYRAGQVRLSVKMAPPLADKRDRDIMPDQPTAL